MIEIRWFVDTQVIPGTIAVPVSPTQAARLQYRVHTPTTDASGALCPGPAWSEWKEIPVAAEQPKARIVVLR